MAINALQERQLLLSESVNDQLKEILANQRALAQQNEELRKDNRAMAQELNLVKSSTNQHVRRRRSLKRSSDVLVPLDLGKRFKIIYNILVKRGVITPYNFLERADAGENKVILEKLKKELKEENGGENCPWTDLQIERQFKIYYKTRKDRERRLSNNINNVHVSVCKYQRRINAKLERRMAAFDRIKHTLSEKNVEKATQILTRDFMSSEESDYEEYTCDDGTQAQRRKGFVVRGLPWERTKLKSVKKLLDNEHTKHLSQHAVSMSLPRIQGLPSQRAKPDGPSWAVRGTDENPQ